MCPAWNLADAAATDALGQALARAFPGGAQAGAVLHLHGELGAGKSTCARSLLRALGVVGLVRSPSYTLVEVYRLGTLTCVHVDLFRLQSPEEVDELGLRDYLGPGYLMLIEWPEKGGTLLPSADLQLTLAYAGEARRASLRAESSFGGAWLAHLGLDTRLSAYVSNLT